MKTQTTIRFLGTVLFATLVSSSATHAQLGLPRTGLPQQGGEAIYKGICQGCHMADAKGAVGAGMYPALASNPKLETAGYPISVIIHGQKAMPAFGAAFSDQQIADVVNYIRTHFGNSYQDKVTPEDVKSAR
ncbi:MAG: c-type cytochrome [Rhizomicrobium sp.]